MRSARGARAAALVCALGGCAGPATTGAPRDPYVVGPVESIARAATASSLLVRAGPGSREPCGISARVDAETIYLARTGTGETRGSSLAAVEVGDTVEVYVEGPVAESCPVQGYASTIVVR